MADVFHFSITTSFPALLVITPSVVVRQMRYTYIPGVSCASSTLTECCSVPFLLVVYTSSPEGA